MRRIAPSGVSSPEGERVAGLVLLTEADLRATLRLVNEARDLPRGSPEQSEYVLRGMARLTGAQVGIWGCVGPNGRLFPTFDFGWSGSAERGVFAEYARGVTRLPDDPSVPRFLSLEPDPVVAATRQDLIEDRDWYGSAHVQELRRAARVDSCVYAGWRCGRRYGALALHRAWGDRPFGDRERSLVAAVATECSFLREEAPFSSLPPRMREVLSLLARGRSEKQIAGELDLSVHTVHHHVKALHQRLCVQSRGELLAVALRIG
ncbi:MAG: response regulator transcription factor [Myxococcales bacterium]